jgi:acyl carrier protein
MKTLLEILQSIRPGVDFRASADFIGEGLLDSFDLINLVNEIEQEFGTFIQGKDILPENFMNFDSINTLIQKNRPAVIGGNS